MSLKIGDKVKIVDDWPELDDFSIPRRFIEEAAMAVYLTIEHTESYIFHLVEDEEHFSWPIWLLEPYYPTEIKGEWPMADPVPEEDYYIHTQPGMYKTYQGPRIGEILGRR